METFVLRWTKDNLPFWQGVDNGEKIEINAVADVINENTKLKRDRKEANEILRATAGNDSKVAALTALLTKETNDG